VNGEIELKYAGTAVVPANTVIDGTGILRFSDYQSRIYASSGTLTLGPGVQVRGGASGGNVYLTVFSPCGVGSDAVPLINQGSIKADQATGLIEVRGSSVQNQGTMEVSNGGIISIISDFSLSSIGPLTNNGGTFVIGKSLQNTGQTLQINAPGAWGLLGTINGGTISGAAGNYLDCAYGAPTLNNVTLNAPLRMSGVLNITGSFSGNGTIEIANPEAIEGNGIVNVATVPAGITIKGGISQGTDPTSDQIRARVNLTTNNGTIRADHTPFFSTVSELRIASSRFPSASPVTNNGSLEVANANTLISLNSIVFGDGGKLVIDGGGQFQVQGNFDLSSAFDRLDISPKTGGGSYADFVAATYTGTLIGTFNEVTPGISVNYGIPGQILISGTPVPEPTAAVVAMGLFALAGRRRRSRGR
jgi:MYXO-CTERM domain-containing protein